jgi:hypothetical protein
MKIYTGYYAKCKQYQDAGLALVSISISKFRYFPVNLEMRGLMPTYQMLRDKYSEDDYFRQILGRTSPKQVFDELLFLGKGKDVILLCFEKEPSMCHRSYISKWLKFNGIECTEFVVEKPVKEDKQLSIF